jgi:exosortase D (VPLPA-CTERM-specific)
VPNVTRQSELWVRLAAGALAAVTLIVLFRGTFQYLYANWHREEYSHGFLIPPISAYLMWQRRQLLERIPLSGSWIGFGIVVLGLGLFFLNFFATIVGADAYALVIVIAGLALAALGWERFKVALVPIGLLLLMNPLPTFWYNHLSAQLQLISSELGVGLMRAFNVTVFLEGNVIDLGNYKLEVAEACSGLRYLFPLMTLGALIAYLFRGKTWTRWCIFVSTIPITVLMNSLRIGIIGVLVDRFGIAQAEGFLHQFEGWVIFMTCFAMLMLECRLLLRFTGDRRPLWQVIRFDPKVAASVPDSAAGGGQSQPAAGGRYGAPPGASPRHGNLPAAAAALILMLAVFPAHALPQRAEVRPSRVDFTLFPSRVGGWIGVRSRLDDVYLDQLKLDDYLMSNFTPEGALAATQAMNAPVNLYVAYYGSQRTGEAAHSPSSCLPGSGWRIEQFAERVLPGVRLSGKALRLNRAIVSQGTDRMLVYYWFQERGRDLTNEYLVKWYLLIDALMRDRTDGALVRFVTPLREGENPAEGDARLERFSAVSVPMLHRYLPD